MTAHTQTLLQDKISQLAKALPDIPRLVEARGMLLANACEVIGLTENQGLHFVVRSFHTGVISVIGNPAIDSIRRAVQQNRTPNVVLAYEDNFQLVAEALPYWHIERAILHTRIDSIRLPQPASHTVRYISVAEIVSHPDLSDELKAELMVAGKTTQVVASFAEGKAVSFCYAGWETETLWDVSIETLAEFRGKGHAVQAVVFLIHEINKRNKHPVWGALESNKASMRLAKKLFFEPVDSLFVFEQKREKS